MEMEMCVSAQASFIVRAGTGAVGLAALKRARSTLHLWLALVPFFFALQQASEGVVWLHVNGDFHATPIRRIAQYTYLAFALVSGPFMLHSPPRYRSKCDSRGRSGYWP